MDPDDHRQQQLLTALQSTNADAIVGGLSATINERTVRERSVTSNLVKLKLKMCRMLYKIEMFLTPNYFNIIKL